jgi:ribonuclease P protein component
MATRTPNALLRLRKHADYQRVYGDSRKQFSKGMAFFFSLRPSVRRSETPGPRVGLTVGKVLGKAVERNRIKRRLRELVRRHVGELGAYPVDVILHPRRTALTVESSILEGDVLQIFRTVRKLLDRGAGGPLPPRPAQGQRVAAPGL